MRNFPLQDQMSRKNTVSPLAYYARHVLFLSLPLHTQCSEAVLHHYCSTGYTAELERFITCCSLAACKYGGGRPGRSGYVRLHQVDRWQTHGGWCRMKNLEALSCTISPSGGGQSFSKAASISLIINARDSYTRQEVLRLGTALSVSTICLPDVIARDQIFPLCICILQAIKYWSSVSRKSERGSSRRHQYFIVLS